MPLGNDTCSLCLSGAAWGTTFQLALEGAVRRDDSYGQDQDISTSECQVNCASILRAETIVRHSQELLIHH